MPRQPKPAVGAGEWPTLIRFAVLVTALLCLKAGGIMAKRPLESEHRKDPVSNRSLGGRTTGPGFAIDWSGVTQPDNADPVDVLKAVKSRMQYLQGTAHGSDNNAKALWELNKAIAILDGTTVEDVGAIDVGGAGFGGSDSGGN